MTLAGGVPTGDDVAFFREHGWWVSPIVLTEDVLATARYGAARYYDGEHDARLLVEVPTDWKPADGDVLRQNDYVSLQVREVAELARHPTLAAMAARLVGASEIRLFHDQLVYKPPGGGGVGWHNDRSYWTTCTSDDMLTAWVPLSDVDEEMGTLAVIDGSHRWAPAEGLETFGDAESPIVNALRDSDRQRWRPRSLALSAGQVSFHHCRTIHGSGPNRRDRPRVALAIHYQDGSNRWRRQVGRDGRSRGHINDLLCRRDAEGRPDYRDDEICPRLWPV